jgi:anti-sigma factor RsiW
MNESAMPNANNHEKIRELTWRKNLSPAQQKELESWLAAHPEKRESFALESQLTASLQKLPDAPVSSNFTARVLEQARLEQRSAGRKPFGGSFILRWRWLVQTATAIVLVAAIGITWKQLQSARTAGEMARTVSLVSEIPSLPSPELLRDFEAIQALGQAPPADMELLALLK